MSKKYTLLTFKGICMNFLLELKFFILSHPLTSKQPPKVVQMHMTHPVDRCGQKVPCRNVPVAKSPYANASSYRKVPVQKSV